MRTGAGNVIFVLYLLVLLAALSGVYRLGRGLVGLARPRRTRDGSPSADDTGGPPPALTAYGVV